MQSSWIRLLMVCMCVCRVMIEIISDIQELSMPDTGHIEVHYDILKWGILLG